MMIVVNGKIFYIFLKKFLTLKQKSFILLQLTKTFSVILLIMIK